MKPPKIAEPQTAGTEALPVDISATLTRQRKERADWEAKHGKPWPYGGHLGKPAASG